MMPSAATIIGYRVTAEKPDGSVLYETFSGDHAMTASLRRWLEWERAGYAVEHEALVEDTPCTHPT